MSKDKISDYSQTANSNTDIGGINVDEGCAPSGINDAIRTLMKQLKDWQSGSQDIYIHPAGSASAPSITATGDTNTGVFFPAADTVGITTGGNERARVDSSGNLGLGVTPSAWSNLKAIQLTNGISLASFSGGATPNAYLSTNIYFNGSNWIFNGTYGASRYEQVSGQHQWFGISSGTAGGTATLPQLMTLDASGGLKTLNTIGVGNTAPSTSGAGITFPATQSASSDANTLDDYEEGTFTAGLTFGGGSTGITFGNNTFAYQKVGNTVHISGYMSLTNKGSSTGNVKITGLPFAAASGNASYSCTALHLDSTSFSGYPHGFVAPTANAIDLMNAYDAGGSSTFLTNSNFSNSSGLIVNLTYRT